MGARLFGACQVAFLPDMIFLQADEPSRPKAVVGAVHPPSSQQSPQSRPKWPLLLHRLRGPSRYLIAASFSAQSQLTHVLSAPEKPTRLLRGDKQERKSESPSVVRLRGTRL